MLKDHIYQVYSVWPNITNDNSRSAVGRNVNCTWSTSWYSVFS